MEMYIRTLPYILSIVTTVLAGFCTWKVKKIAEGKDDQRKEEEKRQKAMAEGIQSLLRESIVDSFNKYQEKGFCPIYAKENVKKLYAAYHDLDGNDVATELYRKILAMPEE